VNNYEFYVQEDTPYGETFSIRPTEAGCDGHRVFATFSEAKRNLLEHLQELEDELLERMRHAAYNRQDIRRMRRDEVNRLGRRPQVRGPSTCGPAVQDHTPWHEGTHAWMEHDGYSRHQHSVNGALTIHPNDTGLHFKGGPIGCAHVKAGG
jgi:hypothetical protein